MTDRWHRIDDPENPPPKDGTVILVTHYLYPDIVRSVRWVRPGYWMHQGTSTKPSHWTHMLPPPPPVTP